MLREKKKGKKEQAGNLGINDDATWENSLPTLGAGRRAGLGFH